MKKIREHTLLALISGLFGLILWAIFCRQGEILENQNQALENHKVMLNEIHSINDTLNKWFDASISQEDLDYIKNWLK